MTARSDTLVQLLGLAPHPEGGWYREVFRSAERVTRADGAARDALTTIQFLLVAGTHSRWHRVAADEVWHHYEGAPLELLCIDPTLTRTSVVRLGPVDDVTRPVHTVPAGWWQAARTTGEYTLVGCTVGPGFEFADFRMLADDAALAAVVRRAWPMVASLV